MEKIKSKAIGIQISMHILLQKLSVKLIRISMGIWCAWSLQCSNAAEKAGRQMDDKRARQASGKLACFIIKSKQKQDTIYHILPKAKLCNRLRVWIRTNIEVTCPQKSSQASPGQCKRYMGAQIQAYVILQISLSPSLDNVFNPHYSQYTTST